MPASPLSTRERRLRGSISSRNCPLVTRSPSATASPVTLPIVSALILTSVLGWILPDAETIDSRLRFWIASVVTVTPSTFLNLRFANPMAASSTTTPVPIRIFFLRVMNASVPVSGEELRAREIGDAHGDHRVENQERRCDRLRSAPIEHCETDGQHDRSPDVE